MGRSIKTRFTYIKLLFFLIILKDKIVEIGNIIEQLKSYFEQYIHVGTIFHISRNDNSHHPTGFPRSHHIYSSGCCFRIASARILLCDWMLFREVAMVFNGTSLLGNVVLCY